MDEHRPLYVDRHLSLQEPFYEGCVVRRVMAVCGGHDLHLQRYCYRRVYLHHRLHIRCARGACLFGSLLLGRDLRLWL